jgi:hypothetical protein
MRGGKFVFGRQAVIDRDHGTVRRVGKLPANHIMAIQVANDPAAAVEIHHRRQPGTGRRSKPAIKAQRQRPARPRHEKIAHRLDIGGGRAHRRPRTQILLARRHRAERLQQRGIRARRRLKQSPHLRVQLFHTVISLNTPIIKTRPENQAAIVCPRRTIIIHSKPTTAMEMKGSAR